MKKASKEAIEISTAIARFLNEYAPFHLTQSEETLKSYEDTLKIYINYLETERKITCADLSWTCFEAEIIEDWMKWLEKTRGNCHSTINDRLSSLRTFLKYVGKHDIKRLCIYEKATSIPLLKTEKRKIESLTKDSVKAILSVPDLTTAIGRRDLCIITLLYSTAARISEVRLLKINQIHLESNKPYVIVRGKGNKIRTLYLRPNSAKVLKGYLGEFHGKKPEPDNYLFPSRVGDGCNPLTTAAIDKRLKIYAKAAHELCPDVPLNLHPHHFRHAKASHWLEDGLNIVNISFLLGHRQLETTMIYVEVSEESHRAALASLENDEDRAIKPKWEADESLSKFCGLSKNKIS